MLEMFKKLILVILLITSTLCAFAVVMIPKISENSFLKWSLVALIFASTSGSLALVDRKKQSTTFNYAESKSKFLIVISVIMIASTMVIVPEVDPLWYINVEIAIFVAAVLILGIILMLYYFYINSAKRKK